MSAAGTLVPFADSLKFLGVTLDSSLSLDRHVSDVVRSCNYHIWALRHIRQRLTPEVVKIAACGIVGAWTTATACSTECQTRTLTNCSQSRTASPVWWVVLLFLPTSGPLSPLATDKTASHLQDGGHDVQSTYVWLLTLPVVHAAVTPASASH